MDTEYVLRRARRRLMLVGLVFAVTFGPCLVVGVIVIVGALSLAAGVAFGGARVLLRKFFPGPIFGHANQTEFISLDLGETSAESSASASSSRADRPKSS